MSIILRIAPDNWYQEEGARSIELLLGYVRTTERNAKHTVEDYKGNKETYTTEYTNEVSEEVEVYEGLDSSTWALDHLLEEYFPNLQRWGTLTTIYAFLEHEMERLCSLFVRDMRLTVTTNNMKGQGVERAMSYLTKVVGLPFDNRNETWHEIRTIQKIRNMIVHGNGEYPAAEHQREAELLRYIANSDYLSYKQEVTIKEGFLDHVLTLFETLFRMIDQLIKTRNST